MLFETILFSIADLSCSVRVFRFSDSISVIALPEDIL